MCGSAIPRASVYMATLRPPRAKDVPDIPHPLSSKCFAVSLESRLRGLDSPSRLA